MIIFNGYGESDRMMIWVICFTSLMIRGIKLMFYCDFALKDDTFQPRKP